MLAMPRRFVSAKTDMKAGTWRPIGRVSAHADTRALIHAENMPMPIVWHTAAALRL
jgi:hypothetical protein